MDITVRVKNTYGKTVFYPECRMAQQFADMLGQKTLTRDDLTKIKNMEINIVIKHEEVQL